MSEAIPILPMKEALKFWRKKIPLTAEKYRALQEEYRVRAFTVAKLAQLDQIVAVKKSIRRALKTGESFEEWQQKSADIFIRAGWKGDTRYRLDTIFRTNIQTAYNAGRWKQAEAGKKDRPYAMYDAVNDGRARLTHLAQDGKVYPLDSAFWRVWWPPNGFRCRCSAITMTEAEAKAEGLEIRDRASGPNPKEEDGKPLEVGKIGPPDEGFGANPGLHPFEVKLDRYYPDAREYFLTAMEKENFAPAILKNFLTKRDLSDIETLRWANKQGKNEDFSKWAAAVLDRKQARGQVHPVAKIPAHVLPLLPRQPRLATVLIDDEQLLHLYRPPKIARGAALSKREVRSIPKYFTSAKAEWFWDTKKGKEGLLLAQKRPDGTYLKLVIFLDYDWKRDRKINSIRTAGEIGEEDIHPQRYKKIAPTMP